MCGYSGCSRSYNRCLCETKVYYAQKHMIFSNRTILMRRGEAGVVKKTKIHKYNKSPTENCKNLWKYRFLFFLICPFGIASVLGIVSFIIGWEWLLLGHDKGFYLQPFITHRFFGVALLAITVLLLFWFYTKATSNIWLHRTALFLFSIVILIFYLQG